MDFDLIRTLNGKPFPIDWRGQLFGNVLGRGGRTASALRTLVKSAGAKRGQRVFLDIVDD